MLKRFYQRLRRTEQQLKLILKLVPNFSNITGQGKLRGNIMHYKIITISLVCLSCFACDTKERVKAGAPEQSMPATSQAAVNRHTVKVEEAIHAKSYTYLRVREGEQEYWIATAKQPIEAGMTLYYDQGMEMKDFASKELDRTFESIWFVGKMSGKSSRSLQNNSPAATGSSVQVVADKSISVEKVPGGLNIQELYTDMAKYEGEIVSIRGKVTKFNKDHGTQLGSHPGRDQRR